MKNNKNYTDIMQAAYKIEKENKKDIIFNDNYSPLVKPVTSHNEIPEYNLTKKSKSLTGFLEYLIEDLKNPKINIITPKNPQERGCQLSIQVKDANRQLHALLTQSGVISDWREPDVIRVAPAPLYNSYQDVFEFVQRLKKVLN